MLLKITVLALLLTLVSGFEPVKPLLNEEAAAKWLLPKTVIPIEYDIFLNTHVELLSDPKNGKNFEGTAIITVDVKEEVDGIILHRSNDMTINNAILQALDNNGNAEGAPFPLNFATYDPETSKLTLKTLTGKIAAKTYKVSLDYVGVHGDDMHGFYWSSYTNATGATRWLLTTQFESYDARRAFPCFDEPEFKAKYVITVAIASQLKNDGYSVLSNMPLEEGYPMPDPVDANVQLYKFQKSSMKISSYLVAFIVSDFLSTSPAYFEGSNKKPFMTWAQRSPIEANQGEVSQLAGPATLDVLAKQTGVNYGYLKVDQVGIPDFNAGAMENWGLVTYRERNILFDEKIHPISQKQSVVTVTAHELAHQWFGDLVTLHWWSDIWLNEGFARFFQYYAGKEIKVNGLDTSSWKLMEQMCVNEVQGNAFSTDAQPNSRALTTEVYTPGEIDANFDDVAYAKGGSVIRMWMHALGDVNFLKALNSYLTANQEDVGTPEKLLAEFDKVVPENLQKILKPSEDFAFWHKQAGYPVLHVNRTGNQSVITQERYLVSGTDDRKPKWTVPITVTTSTKPDFTNTAPSAENIFKSTAESITVNHDDADWVLLNLQQTGYYRVNYDAAGWQALTDTLIKDPNVIHEVNRAQLLDDALWLARSTNDYHTSYGVALNLTKFLNKEVEYIPWKAALNGFNFLYGKLSANQEIEPKIKNLILDRIQGIFSNLTLTPNATTDSHTRRLLRPLVAAIACKLGHSGCVDQAKELFDAHVHDSSKSLIPPDVMSTVLCSGVRAADEATWNKLWAQFKNAADNSVQTLYLAALGCSTNEQIILGYLNKTLDSDSDIRRQDKASVFSSVYNGNRANVAVALKFLSDNLETIAMTYSGLDPLGGLLTGISATLGTADDVKTITALKDKINASTIVQVHNGLTGAVKAVDIVTGNKAWLDQKQKSISDWLDADSKATTGGASIATAALFTLLMPALLFKLLY